MRDYSCPSSTKVRAGMQPTRLFYNSPDICLTHHAGTPRSRNMRILSCALLSTVLALGSVSAGSFGGPAPFRNGSPLSTGNDGSYQGTMSGTNLTGIVGFAISGGIQTSQVSRNSWIAFADGQILRGSVSAAIEINKITGILDSGGSNLATDENGSVLIPQVIAVGATATSGSFQATLDQKNPNGKFTGNGTLVGSAGQNLQFIVIAEANEFAIIPSSVVVTLEPNPAIAIPGGSTPETPFSIRGVRVNTSAFSGDQSTSTASLGL